MVRLNGLFITFLLVVTSATAGIVPEALAAGQASRRPSGPAIVRITGVVLDHQNAIPLPGVPVEVVGGEVVFHGRRRQVRAGAPSRGIRHEGVDGRLPGAAHQSRRRRRSHTDRRCRAGHEGSSAVSVTVEARHRRRFLVGRSAAHGAQELPPSSPTTWARRRCARTATRDAAAAMSRVTGLSVVDNQYVFVRGLGERYSNTTLAGAVSDDRAGQEGRAARPVPHRPDRQRAGRESRTRRTSRRSSPAASCRSCR